MPRIAGSVFEATKHWAKLGYLVEYKIIRSNEDVVFSFFIIDEETGDIIYTKESSTLLEGYQAAFIYLLSQNVRNAVKL